MPWDLHDVTCEDSDVTKLKSLEVLMSPLRSQGVLRDLDAIRCNG